MKFELYQKSRVKNVFSIENRIVRPPWRVSQMFFSGKLQRKDNLEWKGRVKNRIVLPSMLDFRSIFQSNVCNTPFQLRTSFSKKLKNCLIETFRLQIRIQHLRFSVEAMFYTSSHKNVDFIMIKSFKICKGFYHEKCPREKISPRAIFHGQILYKFSNF